MIFGISAMNSAQLCTLAPVRGRMSLFSENNLRSGLWLAYRLKQLPYRSWLSFFFTANTSANSCFFNVGVISWQRPWNLTHQLFILIIHFMSHYCSSSIGRSINMYQNQFEGSKCFSKGEKHNIIVLAWKLSVLFDQNPNFLF